MTSRLLLALFVSALAVAQTVAFKDDFSDPKLQGRRAARGPWKFENKIATCTQDDAIYAKAQNHGPIIFYDRAFTDGTLRLSYKAEKCRSVVFTANGEKGHVFRFVTSATGTTVRAFPPGDDHKSIELARGPALTLGEWVDVIVQHSGTKVTVKIGKDFTQTVESPHYAAAKSNFSIGFAFGTLSVKDVALE